MDVQHVAVSMPGGRVAILQIVMRAPLAAFSSDAAASHGFVVSGEAWERQVTDEGVEQELSRSAGLEKRLSWRRIDPSEIPQDRVFRNAWVDSGKLAVDMPRAREIHRARLRDLRAPLFGALDAAVNKLAAKALTGNLTAAERTQVAGLEAKRQALRDVTSDPAIDAATTADELAAAVPAALKSQT